MWEQPHYRYTVATENQPGLVSTLPALETEVPGTLVYGLVRNSRTLIVRCQLHIFASLHRGHWWLVRPRR